MGMNDLVWPKHLASPCASGDMCSLRPRLHKDKLVSLFDVCASKALAALETGGLAREVGLSLVKW